MARRHLNLQSAGRYIQSLTADRLDGLLEACTAKLKEQGIDASSRASRAIRGETTGPVTGSLRSIITWVSEFDLADYDADEQAAAKQSLQAIHAVVVQRLRVAGRKV